MRLTTEDDEGWWPPILVPSGFGRVLAWWTESAASQSTRRWMLSSTARSARGSEEAIGSITLAHYADSGKVAERRDHSLPAGGRRALRPWLGADPGGDQSPGSNSMPASQLRRRQRHPLAHRRRASPGLGVRHRGVRDA